MVIGLGNQFRRDDAVGLIAARRLRESGIPAEEHEGDLAALIEKWRGSDRVILIDAVVSGARPGTIHRLDVSASPLNRELFKPSTHVLSLADVVELSRTLGTLPPSVLLFGVEIREATAGVGLSAEVEAALPALVAHIAELTSMTPQRGPTM